MNTEKKNKDNEKEKSFTIYINGRERTFEGKEITFKEVVELAFGTMIEDENNVYTVTFKKGEGEKPAGEMVKGDVVKVKNEMIFNATRTNRS